MFDTNNLSNAFTFRKREELLQKSEVCEREGKKEQAWKLKGQAIEVTYDHEDSDDVLHTVPFKVLGSPYSLEHQKYLEDAHKLLYERKGDVNAKIVPENNNQHDKNAIAVMLRFAQEWKKVGYIARELTQFLHPLLKQDKITNVCLKHIKFRATYQKVGFYATIEITRRGAWEQSVVKASKKVG